MEIQYRLIAEVMKHWRSDSEERALAKAILYMTGLNLEELQKLSVQEVTDILVEVIRRPESKIQTQCSQKEDQAQKEQAQKVPNSDEYSLLSLEEDLQELEIDQKPQEEPTLSFIELKKLKRGRPKVEKETN